MNERAASFTRFLSGVAVLWLLSLGACAIAGAAETLELLFTYGSEKQPWIEDVTKTFNAGDVKTESGKRIQVSAVPLGSGEAMEELLSGKRKAHIVSPASGAFIELANAESQDKQGINLVGETRNLVLSPVVIAMWKPMAEALGWGKKPVGWSDILALADNPQGWAAHGFPQWGKFKFGHTHPEHSNSGLIALLAEVYAATGKTRGLTLEDVNSHDTRHFVQSIEKSVVHYGRSTGFFGRTLLESGPEYLSAAVLYENMVIEAYDPKYKLPYPLVAVYPKEGTFWSDHPAGIVNRDWVTPEHREAAQIYLDYLVARPQQEKAMRYGFRPADVDIPLHAPFDAAHGVDASEPKTTLQVPKARVMRAILDLWYQEKKHANIVLVMDTSGSMSGEKIQRAREGAARLLAAMGDEDRLSLLAFSTRLNWLTQGATVKDHRAELAGQINGLQAGGATALYDAVGAAYDYLRQNPVPGYISAVVVLTDGADTSSHMKLDKLLQLIPVTQQSDVRVFTIGYGRDAEQEVLKRIAGATRVSAYQGNPEDIDKVFQEISTFL